MATRPDIIRAVMSVPGVLDVEIVTNEDNESVSSWVVNIVATANLPDESDRYSLRADIMLRVAGMRPAGIEYAVYVKRPGDILLFGAVKIPPGARMLTVTEFAAGTPSSVQVFNTPEEVMAAFGGGEPPPAWPQRNRFHALADELTSDIAPLKKPSPTVTVVPAYRQLFEQVIDVKERSLAPCPKCACQAFTPNAKRDRVICRGCPLPSPTYAINNIDAWGFDSRNYKCGKCGKVEPVTMMMSELNLYCSGCGVLTLHSKQKELTQRFAGSKAIVTFNDVVIGTATNVEFVEAESEDAFDDGSAKKPPSGKITVTRVGEVPNDWVTAIDKMNERVASELAIPADILFAANMKELEPGSSPAANLIPLFIAKLGLRPLMEYAQRQYNENRVRGDLKERDWERRTGRTTRSMLFAIADYVTSDARLLCVVAATERYTKQLANEVRDVYEKLNLARRMDVRPLMPADYDDTFDYMKRDRVKVFADHTWAERKMSR